MKNLKRKYGETAFVKKSKKVTSYNQGKFIRAQKNKSPEKKVIDTANAVYACDTTGSVTFISGAAQGVDFNQMIGRKATNTVVQLEGFIQNQDSIMDPGMARVMIVYDKESNGAAVPAITDILTASTSNAFMNLNNRERFVVIYNEEWYIGATNAVATTSFAQAPSGALCKTYKAGRWPTIRNGAAATAAVANYQSGTLLLVTIGSNAAGAGSEFIGAVRVRFEDD